MCVEEDGVDDGEKREEIVEEVADEDEYGDTGVCAGECVFDESDFERRDCAAEICLERSSTPSCISVAVKISSVISASARCFAVIGSVNDVEEDCVKDCVFFTTDAE